MTHPIENDLRPAVEFAPAAAATIGAVLCLYAPGMFLMPPKIALAAATVLAGLAGVRAAQGYAVLRYRENLRRLPRYVLHAKDIPVSKHRLFLGRGFRWTARHTQRVFQARDPQARERYLLPGRLYRAARALELGCENVWGLRWLTPLLRKDSGWNPVRPLPPVGGDPVLHGIEPEETDVYMDLNERVGHTLVVGTTRVGKTREAEVFITQDIARGDVVIVFDPKGDETLLLRMHAEAVRAGREHEFYMLHLGHPELSARYNPIGSFTRVTEVATRVTGPLPSEGNSAAFRAFAWRFTNSIARALVALGRKPDYPTIQRYVTNIEALFIEYTEQWLTQGGPADWKAAVQRMEGRVGQDKNLLMTYKGRSHHAIALAEYLIAFDLYDPVADSLRGAFTYDRTFFDKLTASLLPLLEKLTTGKVAEVLAPDYGDTTDPRPIIEWEQIIRRRGIVYIGLDALSDPAVASAVGNGIFADLTSVAGHLYKFGMEHGLPPLTPDAPREPLPRIALHADEFNELVGEEFIPMVNKAGGAGFQVTVYTQTISDIEARFGSRAKAGQVIGNLNTLIMLRVKNVETARILTDQLPPVRVLHKIASSGTTDSNDPSSTSEFTSRNEDRITDVETSMVAAADLVQLPKGQAFALIEGGQLWKIRMPLADPHDPLMLKNIYAVDAALKKSRGEGRHDR